MRASNFDKASSDNPVISIDVLIPVARVKTSDVSNFSLMLDSIHCIIRVKVLFNGGYARPLREPDDLAPARLEAFLSEFADAAEFVVKPCVGAGSRDAQRYSRRGTASIRQRQARPAAFARARMRNGVARFFGTPSVLG